MRDLIVLDEYENYLERNQTPPVDIKAYVNNSSICKAYKGFHHLVRTYLKTMQWVLDYYLSPNGLVQYGWEFNYPFTPLCSDLAVYCKLF